MKPRALFSLIVAVTAALILYAAIAGIGQADDPPAPEPAPPETVTVETVVQGKTAAGWHRVAGRYLTSVRSLNRKPAPWGGHSLERAFQCIHSHEGAWSDPSAPYWGGLQMDQGFQRKYGAWALSAFGTADRWPVSVQIAVAIRAWASGRGFAPWPNTARYCGLR